MNAWTVDCYIYTMRICGSQRERHFQCFCDARTVLAVLWWHTSNIAIQKVVFLGTILVLPVLRSSTLSFICTCGGYAVVMGVSSKCAPQFQLN